MRGDVSELRLNGSQRARNGKDSKGLRGMMAAGRRLGTGSLETAANLCLIADVLTLTKAKKVTGHRLSGKSRLGWMQPFRV